jgi:hypothetical protein
LKSNRAYQIAAKTEALEASSPIVLPVHGDLSEGERETTQHREGTLGQSRLLPSNADDPSTKSADEFLTLRVLPILDHYGAVEDRPPAVPMNLGATAEEARDLQSASEVLSCLGPCNRQGVTIRISLPAEPGEPPTGHIEDEVVLDNAQAGVFGYVRRIAFTGDA